MGQRVYYGFLGGKNESLCSVVNILPISSGMSTRK